MTLLIVCQVREVGSSAILSSVAPNGSRESVSRGAEVETGEGGGAAAALSASCQEANLRPCIMCII